ncbi:phosphotransferase [Paenibacillus sp. LMG 31458]|uniref:Phosphotransferase n=1 Tax=Paenibacillus phytorum TaxID=2654977 RepID=A0ABX1Y6A8_9BACL|nr:aminoglycoside phosphotransferase family protein [Paenibacillus phytorum]NOU75771.1 phosphotransferase [Paenibacillus phytorum]
MPLWTDFNKDFGLRVKRRKKIRDVYQVFTTTGRTLCYKPYKTGEDEVAFIRKLFVHLDNKGYRYTPKPVEGPGQKLWSFHRGQYWLLTNWVKGRSPNFTRESELMKGFRTLAKFHRLAEGVTAEGIPKGRIRYDELYRRPGNYRSEISRYGGSLDRFIDCCHKAEAFSQKPAIASAVEMERNTGAFSHGDYNYPNLVLDRSNHLHLIDLENASMNVRMIDLAHILYRNYPWNGRGVLKGIEEYDRKRPLSAEDRHLLYMLLLLPYPLVRAMKQFGNHYPRHIELPSSSRLSGYKKTLRKIL